MAENNQLSDETKNNSTDTSSTDASSAVIGNHENAVVPHKISNHDKLVQTMVMVDGEWINVNDTNDQANMKEDMHKVNKKVVEAEKGIVEAKNTADSAVKYADSAVSASKVNSDALVAQSSAISEAKAAADDAASKAQFIKENASSEAAAIRNQVADVANNVSSVKADVASAASDVANLKVDVQANSAAIIKTNEAVSVQSKSSSDAINELKIANGQVESIAKDAKNNATVAKQTADTATTLAQDAKSNAVLATQTATSATVEATNATSTATKAELSVSGLTTRVTAVEGDNKKLSNQITSTETILQQAKDQLLQKADKSVVDQANNLISQLSAEQKTMADQINQKVSSTEYQTLKDKVNNLRIGGRNLIPNSGTDIVVESKTTDAYPQWDNHLLYSSLQSNTTYTFSVSATNTNGVEQASVRIFKESLDGKFINKEAAHWYFNADGKRRSFTFTTPNDAIPYDIWLYAGHMGKSEGKNFVTTYHHPQLEMGNVESDYSPNPDDAIASIKKNSTAIDENSKALKLKADATEVNNLKGTVNSHSASINLFSDQLKSMVTESKVNDIINGKGFTTQNTVQSLIDQKSNTMSESIVKLSNDVRNNGGGINLLRSTDVFSKVYWIYDNIENRYKDSLVELEKVGTTASRIYQSLSVEATEHVFSVSFDAQISDDCTDTDVIVSCGPYDALQNVRVTGKDLKHYKVENWTWASTSNNFSLYVGNGKIRLSKLKLEYGPVATPYAPAPSDNASVNQLQSVTASIDGLQSAVTNYQKDASSKYTQLSDLMQSKVNKGDLESVRTQLASSINERIQKGNLITQFNLEAGRTLIQSNKIYFDADSFVMSPNSKAFIPSAYITDINADKITTGTLDAAKLHVKNFSADDITGGTLKGVVVKTGTSDQYFQTSQNNIYWVKRGGTSLIGNDTYLNTDNGLTIADTENILLTTWGGANANGDNIINNSGNAGHPKIVVDMNGSWDPDDPNGSSWGSGPRNSEIVQWVGNKEYSLLERSKGFTFHLDDGNNESKFKIQKDNKVGFYVGGGSDGNEIQIAGSGPIKLQGKYLDDGFDDGMTHTLGNLQVDNLHVRKWLGVDQSKNAIVKTSQGPVTINAYETAEYYFGDIGEGQTSADGIAYIGIEKLFNETVNTTIPYHVFITAYGPGDIWVDQREHNRFIVKSDQPNLKFSWEIKAKRKGYEHTRLQNVDDKLNRMAATS
ncbi:gp58-like family protein [Limosilactobacillus caviae]|uniref:gp58-like family protein n=1 Tax=Limosilactobacillus caviae TaxID=1769424 RepID=UPI003516106F